MKLNLTAREYILIVLILVLGGGMAYLYSLNEYNKEQYMQVAKVNAGLGEQIKTFKDENGVLHSRIQVMEVDRKAYVEANRAALDSLADALDIKLKNIKGLLNITTQTIGHIDSKIDTGARIVAVPIPGKNEVRYDTVNYYKIDYKDAFMDFKGELDRERFTATYKLTDSLTFVTYTKRKGFLGLGRQETFLDVQAKNPNMTFTQMKDIRLTKVRDKLWSVGPFVGYGFNGTRMGLTVGIGIQRSLFKF